MIIVISNREKETMFVEVKYTDTQPELFTTGIVKDPPKTKKCQKADVFHVFQEVVFQKNNKKITKL